MPGCSNNPPGVTRDFEAPERRRLQSKVARRKVTSPTVSRWVTMLAGRGEKGLRPARRAGRLPRLNAAQRQRLVRRLPEGPEIRLSKWAALLLLTFAGGATCFGFSWGIPASPFSLAEGLPARVVHSTRVSQPVSLPTEPTGYRLVLLTGSIGVDVPNGHLHVSGGHRRSLFKGTETGHSWVILESPRKRIECGLTQSSQNWFDGVRKLQKEGNPDPISYLWRDLPDGKRHGHLTGFHPSFAAAVNLTEEQYAAIARFIAGFEFRTFNLMKHECTNFTVETARLVGLELDYQLEIDIPPTAHLFGKDYRVWTDPQYSKLEIATPDVLERSLRELAKQGIVQDVTKLY